MTRIMIGTLYSGENEFEECVTSIQKQSYRNFEHFIFKNLPNKEAHHTLFKSFKENADKYGLLVKVDADMVLCSSDLLAQIVRKMTDLPNIDVYSIAVTDFFTGDLINGLNCYRNTVTWEFSKQTMFVDIPEVSREKTCYDQTDLAPAAIHCKNPSKFQAFHYGVHRGLKSLQKIHSTTHWAMLREVWLNFLSDGDVRIGLAVLGAELVYAGRFTKDDVDYTNPRVAQALNKYKDLSSSEIKKEILKLRALHWGVLPSDLRRRMLRRKFNVS